MNDDYMSFGDEHDEYDDLLGRSRRGSALARQAARRSDNQSRSEREVRRSRVGAAPQRCLRQR
jgi:hypothetical protein